MALDGGDLLTEVRAWKPRLGLLLNDIIRGVNQVGTGIGVDPTGHIDPPSPPQALSIKAATGLVHATISDSTQRSRNLHYFIEADTNPSFPQPHVEHLGVSRGRFLNLPALDDNGNPQNWYFRTYSMYPGSKQRSNVIVFGGSTTPTPVNVGGTVQLTPMPSTGSGTASTTGRQGASGFGKAQFAKSA